MDRMKRPARRAAGVLVLLALALATTCSNPIDIVSEVQREVMLANDRFLEVTGVELAEQTSGLLNPDSFVEVVFDRPISAGSVDSSTVHVYKGSGTTPVAIVAAASGERLEIRGDPFFDSSTTYRIVLDGIKAADGSGLADPFTASFGTHIQMLGSVSVVSTDPLSTAGYTRVRAVIATISSNNTVEEYMYSTDPTVLDAEDPNAAYNSQDWYARTESAVEIGVNLDEGSDGERKVYARFRRYDPGTLGYSYSSLKESAIVYDATPPTVETKPAREWTNGVREYTAALAIIEANVAGYEWTAAGDIDVALISPQSITTGVTGSVEGETTLRLTVTDLAGNIGYGELPFGWDVTPPAFELGGSVYANAPALFEVAPVEALSGIATWAWSGASLVFSAPDSGTTFVSSAIEASHEAVLTVVDHAGNEYVDVVDFIWDVSAPSAPSVPGLSSLDDTGRYEDDSVTLISSDLDFSGTAEAFALVEITVDSIVAGACEASAEGVWTVALDVPEGIHVVEARQTDRATNTGPLSSALALVVDLTPPAVPTPPDLRPEDDTGVSDADDITATSSGLVFTSSVDDDCDVTLYDGSTAIIASRSSGTTWTALVDLANGTHALSTRALDPAGNSSSSPTVPVVVDTVVPVVNVGADFYAKTGYQDSLSATVVEANLHAISWTRESGVEVGFGAPASTTTSLSSSTDGLAVLRCTVTDSAGNAAFDEVSMTWDATAPSAGAWRVDGAAAYALTAGVTLAPVVDPTDATSGVYQMQFSNNGTLWSAWEEYSSSKAWNLVTGEGGTTTEGARTVRFRVRDRALNVSATVDDSIIYDATAPTSGAWYVNAGNPTYTNSAVVNIVAATAPADSGSGIAQIRFSNNGGAAWSAWEAYGTPKAWDLQTGAGGSATQGTRAVTVQVMDGAGRTSATTSDSIVYDYSAPSPGAWQISGTTVYTNAASHTVAKATDPGDAYSGIASQCFSNDNATWTAWEGYTGSKTSWNLTSGYGGTTAQGTKYVYVKVRDGAGNESAATSDSIVYDTVAPTVDAVTNTYSGSSQSYLKSGTYTFTAAVTNTGTGTIAPVADVKFYRDSASTGTTTLVATDTVAAYTWAWDTSATTEGTWYVKAVATDAAGNASTVSVNARYLDKTAPVYTASSFSLNAGAAYATNVAVTGAQTVTGADQISFTLYTWNGSAWVLDQTTAWATYAASNTITLAGGDQNKWVYLSVRDHAGNELHWVAYDTITLDTTPPGAPSVADNVTLYNGRTVATSVTWTWTPGGGGNGTYRYAFGTNPPNIETTATSASQSTDGNYTLYVIERDAAGNWSAAASASARLTPCIPYNGESGIATTLSTTNRVMWRADPKAVAYRFRFRYSTNGGTTWSAWTTPQEISVNYIVTGTLPAGAIIRWQIYASLIPGVWPTLADTPYYQFATK